MGRSFISGTIKARSKESFLKKIHEMQEQDAYEHGHSYSGASNMLDTELEYTLYEFQRSMKPKLEDWTADELKFEDAEGKKRVRKLMSLKKKHDILAEITIADLAKYQATRKVVAWKKFILDYFWHPESDILWYIPVNASKYVWFGWARC